MSKLHRGVFATLALCTGLGMALSAQGEDGAAAAPVVVELFTSQGCSSCPPAEALLGELSLRPNIVALSFHVDYWDYIGWKDPFATPTTTERQRAYSRALGLRVVYTPQIVVDGTREAVGSERGAVEGAISATAAAGGKTAVRIARDGGGHLRAVIPAGAADAPATVWLALYDFRHSTTVKRGENAGSTLTEHNVVREWRKIGEWTGAATEIPFEVAANGRDGCAVIVQAGGSGRILGAATISIRPESGS